MAAILFLQTILRSLKATQKKKEKEREEEQMSISVNIQLHSKCQRKRAQSRASFTLVLRATLDRGIKPKTEKHVNLARTTTRLRLV